MARMWRANDVRVVRGAQRPGGTRKKEGTLGIDTALRVRRNLDCTVPQYCRHFTFHMCSLSAGSSVEVNADARWCIAIPVTWAGACGGDSNCGVVARFIFRNNPVLVIFERSLLPAADATTDVRKARPVVDADEEADEKAGCACNCDGNNERSHLVATLLSSSTP